MLFSAPGDVTAPVLAIPETSRGPDQAVLRRTLPGSQPVRSHSLLVASAMFAGKIALAAAAGAAAAVISNNMPGDAACHCQYLTAIPALFTTMAIGDDLRGLLAFNEVTARVAVPVPAPSLVLDFLA